MIALVILVQRFLVGVLLVGRRIPEALREYSMRRGLRQASARSHSVLTAAENAFADATAAGETEEDDENEREASQTEHQDDPPRDTVILTLGVVLAVVVNAAIRHTKEAFSVAWTIIRTGECLETRLAYLLKTGGAGHE